MSPSQMIFIVNAAAALQQQGNGSVLMGDGSTGVTAVGWGCHSHCGAHLKISFVCY